MYGRSCLCLLAISVLIPHPAVLRGQSRRDDAEFVRSLPPRAVLPPTREPFRHPSPVTQPVPIGLPPIARAAGTIFSGTVMAIARRPVNNGQTVETVAITFHVDNAIRGVTPGEDLTISQWIGLWSGSQRYRVCERVLLFLYPPSKLGLTSCVAGEMGRFTIDAGGLVLLSPPHVSAF